MGDWLKNTPSILPRTDEERHIAYVMRAVDASVRAMPRDIPKSAISVGLINMGVRIGGETTGTRTLADYMRNVAEIIEAHEGGYANA